MLAAFRGLSLHRAMKKFLLVLSLLIIQSSAHASSSESGYGRSKFLGFNSLEFFRRGHGSAAVVEKADPAGGAADPKHAADRPPPNRPATAFEKGMASAGVPVKQHDAWVYLRSTVGWIILLWGVWLWAAWIPGIVRTEHTKFIEQNLSGRTFEQYLTYRFNQWMTAGGIGAMAQLLGIGIMTLLTGGSFIYAILMQDSPVVGLWKCSLWASASAVEPSVTAVEGVIGMFATAGGLVMLAVLLTTISDFFAERIRVSKEGRDPVIEGNHMVLLGFTAHAKEFLEELALCDDPPSAVAVLDSVPKLQLEETIKDQHIETGNIKIVCRQGNAGNAKDLWKVGADTASKVVILDDPSIPRDQADAATFGTLLTLKGQGKAGWPVAGHVAVQSALSKNCEAMKRIYPDSSYILSGGCLGRLMVQSVQDPGLNEIFNQLIGFEGDEFYEVSPKEFRVVGKTFAELPFWFDKSIPVGIKDASGAVCVNPDKNRKINESDEIIVLAEDHSALVPVEQHCFDFQGWLSRAGSGAFEEAEANDHVQVQALICNFTARGFGCDIIFQIDETALPGSNIDIYSSLSEEEIQDILGDAQKCAGRQFRNVKIRKVYTAPPASMTASHRLKDIPLSSYSWVFMLTNDALSPTKADEQNVALVIQMKNLLEKLDPGRAFKPLVQICTPTAADQLELCGVPTYINTTSMMSRALALVSMSPVCHGVLSDLLSAHGNMLDIVNLQDFLEGQPLPQEITFVGITAIVNRAVEQVVIGWSEWKDGRRTWVVNPKDKLSPRPWLKEDCLVVIKKGD